MLWVDVEIEIGAGAVTESERIISGTQRCKDILDNITTENKITFAFK